MDQSITTPRFDWSRLQTTAPQSAWLPIPDAFNWAECVTDDAPLRCFLVAFRSIRRANVDPAVLYEHDEHAYQEALRVPGFIFYHRGDMDNDRACLSFCMWDAPEPAHAARSSTAHREAMSLIDAMYEWYALERYTVIRQDHRGLLQFLPIGDRQTATGPVPDPSPDDAVEDDAYRHLDTPTA